MGKKSHTWAPLIYCHLQLGPVPTTNNFGNFLRRVASGVRYVLFCWCKSMLSLVLQGPFRASLAQMVFYLLDTLKGQCHEIFDFWFFSWISFSQAPEYTTRVVSNFFINSRRYSQLKVCHQRHRWQMQKIFNHKSFKYFVWTPLVSIVNL